MPSGLLVAVTAHISTDVAAAPLLWVLPLSLYLLTWVLVFQGRPLIPHKYVLLLQPLAIAGVIYLLAYGGERNLLMTLGGHQLCFFVIAMACHGELARTRPAAQHLTGFYVALSFGGMVGGLFAGLIAPFAFSWIAEYPILVVLAALCRPKEENVPPRLAKIAKWTWLLVAGRRSRSSSCRSSWGESALAFMRDQMVSIAAGIAALTVVLVVLLRADRYSVAALVAIALLLVRLYPNEDGKVETVRSFFGVHKIVTNADGAYRVLMHGTTIHGAQKLLNADGTPVQGRPEMITYYADVGGIGGAIEASANARAAGLRAAVIGLGAGTLTCQKLDGENWKFFEIDQSMIDTASDPKYFTFIRDCYPDIKPVLGDARLTFAKEPDGAYDLIVVDAYSSDAIPIHLATREAMAIYKQKLAPQGVVLMHVSNRHLELTSVVVGIAHANGLKSWVFSEDAEPRRRVHLLDHRGDFRARRRRHRQARLRRQVDAHRGEGRPAGVDRRLLQRPRRRVAQVKGRGGVAFTVVPAKEPVRKSPQNRTIPNSEHVQTGVGSRKPRSISSQARRRGPIRRDVDETTDLGCLEAIHAEINISAEAMGPRLRGDDNSLSIPVIVKRLRCW